MCLYISRVFLLIYQMEGDLMFKKICLCSFLILSLLICVSNAKAFALDVQPYAVVSVNGGLMNSSGNTYLLWGIAEGAKEYKQITSTIYQKEGSSWIYYDSTSNDGTSMLVETSKSITIIRGYEYKVVAVASTATHSTTLNYFYDFR